MKRHFVPFAGLLAFIGFGSPHVSASKPAEDVLGTLQPSQLVIHYHRFDGNYDTPGLWTWDERKQREPDSPEVLATGQSDFGVYFVLDQSQYGNDDGPQDRIGFIPRLRRDWNLKDGTDRFWSPTLGREIWLIGNDPRIYTERPDTSPKIDQAYIDAENRISLVLSTPLEQAAANPEAFTVTDSIGRSIPVKAVTLLRPQGTSSKLVDLEVAEPLDYLATTITVEGEAYRAAPATLRRVLDDAQRFHTTDPMGATYTPEHTTFRLFSPTATDVKLVLFDQVTGEAGRTEIQMQRGQNGVWSVKFLGDLEGRYYRLQVTSKRYGTVEINDPNATNTTGHDGHSRITDLRRHDPEGFRPIRRPFYGDSPTDAIIYQIHIRDLTVMASSGVTAENKGKYLGLTETNTTLPSDSSIKTALSHLVELGATHVQIQPFHDWDNDERNPDYNWGYMTAFFNSPEGSLSSDFRSTARIAEAKAMIQAIKDSGINVVLDVVYNHTGVQNTFEKSAPGYFLRMRPDGSFWNGSGTGNEFRSEAPMGRQFIIDSLKFWTEEYGIDGYRFDLMGLMDLPTLKLAKAELQKIYPHLIFYGEPWAATGPDGTGIDRITYKDVVRGSGIGAFNDHFRDAIKGSPDGNDPGYIVDGSRRDGVMRGIAGSIDDWAANPVESINYADVHDNLILYDKIKYSAPGFDEAARARMQMLSGGILAVSQGIMLVTSGTDFMRSKQGNHNSYNAGDEINGVRWELKKQHREVFDYYKGVIAIRKAHPLFRLRTATEVRSRLRFHNDGLPAPQAIAFTINGDGLAGETWSEARVLINPTREPLEFKLPEGVAFDVYAHDTKAGVEPLKNVSGTITVPQHSLAILAVGEAESITAGPGGGPTPTE